MTSGLSAPSPFAEAGRRRLAGVWPALVRDVNDPDGQGRVRVELPWVGAEDGPAATPWARLATLMAGAGRGTWFVPEPGDEVLIAFVAGDPRQPVVIGALWNGVDAPPDNVTGGQNNLRSITSRSGHRVVLDDTSGAEKVEIRTAAGHRFLLDDGERKVLVAHSSGAESVEISSDGSVSVTATNRVTIEAPAGLSISAAIVQVDAPMSTFSGVVKCDTLITNSVVSSSYTPGAGNIW